MIGNKYEVEGKLLMYVWGGGDGLDKMQYGFAIRIWIWTNFLESLYEPLLWDSEEASVQIFSLEESYWD